jgi:hypothetical protein
MSDRTHTLELNLRRYIVVFAFYRLVSRVFPHIVHILRYACNI